MTRRLLQVGVALCACVLMVATLAAPAFADSTWVDGTKSTPFALVDAGGLSIVTTGDRDPSITLPYEASTVYDGSYFLFETRSLRVCKDGSYLVAGGKGGYIARISPAGVLTKITAAQIPEMIRPFDVIEMADGGMLIVDRGPLPAAGNGYVLRVDANNKVVWKFGGSTGLGTGSVYDPFTAEPVAGDHTLISDSLGYRVIEVDNTSGAIVWSYGTFMVPGPGDGLLMHPHSAQRLANGNTLICNADEQRVIEVTPAKQVAWSFGTSMVSGDAPNLLNGANSALRLANGHTLISDSGNNRAIEVDSAGTIVRQWGGAGITPAAGGLFDPRAAVRLADGSTVVADNGHARLERYGYEVGRTYTATSGAIDPQPGAFKWFTKITYSAQVPTGSAVKLDYSIDGTHWLAVPANGVLSPVPQSTAIRYRVHMTSASGDVAPALNSVTIAWSLTAPVVGGTKGGNTKPGGGTTKKKTGGTSKSTTTGSSLTGTLRASAGGSGSIPSNNGTTQFTSANPSDSAAGGAGDGSGGAGGAVAPSTTMSGWVMSEVKSSPAGAPEVNKTGVGATSTAGGSRTPSTLLLVSVYAIGLAWAPAAAPLARLVTSLVTH